MKLLFDHNLSPRLVVRLGDLYPEADHVSLVGLDRASDDEVWQYARANGHLIVTRDSDFSDTSAVRGFPPKVIWLRLGNCTTDEAERALRTNCRLIEEFTESQVSGLLELLE